jgi:hypothetical protein
MTNRPGLPLSLGSVVVGLLGGCVLSNDEYLHRQLAPLAEQALACPQTGISAQCLDEKCYTAKATGCGRTAKYSAASGDWRPLGPSIALTTPAPTTYALRAGGPAPTPSPPPPAGAPPAASPPPSAGAPPAASPPPSAGAPPAAFPLPAGVPPGELPLRAGKFVLPYLGLHLPFGTSPAQSSYDTGLRLGTLLGFYVGSHVSINGEFSLDALNSGGSPGTADEVLVGVSFSPLIHFGLPSVEFAVGPRLGHFWDAGTIYGSDFNNTDFSASGFLYGLNVGAFFLPVRGLSFGGLASLSAHSVQSVCCGEGTGHTDFVLAFTVAVLAPRVCIGSEGWIWRAPCRGRWD